MEGVGTAFPASDDGVGIVDDADRGRLERNVKSAITPDPVAWAWTPTSAAEIISESAHRLL